MTFLQQIQIMERDVGIMQSRVISKICNIDSKPNNVKNDGGVMRCTTFLPGVLKTIFCWLVVYKLISSERAASTQSLTYQDPLSNDH